MEWTKAGPVTVAALQHPRFQRLIWTPTGLFAVEYSSTEPTGTEPPDAARLVKINVVGGRGDLEPITEFDPELIDLALTPDGGTMATIKRVGDQDVLEITGETNVTRNVDVGATSVDLRPNGTIVGYRGNDGFFRVWDSGQSAEATVAGHWTSSGTLSMNGNAALAELTDNGPSGEVCVVDTTGLEYVSSGP